MIALRGIGQIVRKERGCVISASKEIEGKYDFRCEFPLKFKRWSNAKIAF
jgi:hypothetical protein